MHKFAVAWGGGGGAGFCSAPFFLGSKGGGPLLPFPGGGGGVEGGGWGGGGGGGGGQGSVMTLFFLEARLEALSCRSLLGGELANHLCLQHTTMQSLYSRDHQQLVGEYS